MVKEQDFLEKKASYCLDLAKKLGASDASVVVNNAISETVNFRNKKLDESNRSDDLGIDITTYIGKKKSSISSSNLLKDNIDVLIEKCIETTKNTPEDEFNSLPDKDLLVKNVKDLNLYDDTHLDNESKIEYLKIYFEMNSLNIVLERLWQCLLRIFIMVLINLNMFYDHFETF